MKKFITFTFGLLLIVALSASSMHEFYVSIAEVNVVNDTAQVSLRIFTDDLELVLKEENKKSFDLHKASEFDKNQRAIGNYLEKVFALGSAGKETALHWFGHEIEDDVVWIYGEGLLSSTASLLMIDNRVLMNHFEDQQNIVHFKRPDGYDSDICTQRDSKVRFALNP